MRRFAGFSVLILLVPATVQAGAAPEALLPATTQVYLRWDGMTAHRAAYAKTAVGRTLAGDTGTFLNQIYKQTQEALGSVVSVAQLLGGVAPEEMQKIQNNANEAAKLVPELGEHGFLVAGELKSIEPPQARLFLVIPDSGANSRPMFGAIEIGTSFPKLPVRETKLHGRLVRHAEFSSLHLAWWSEGSHAVAYLGSDEPEAVLGEIADAGKAKLATSPLFRRITDFKEFETGTRAFVDIPALVKIAAKDQRVGKVLDSLGIRGAGALVMYSGFSGEAERSLSEWDLPGPRKGLLRLVEGQPFRLADVPALPPDTTSWSMTRFDAAVAYDVGVEAAREIAAVFAPGEGDPAKAFVGQAKELLGIDLRQDLLAALGDKVVFYSSWSEGPLTLGETMLIKVRDEKKLQSVLDQAIKALLKQIGNDFSLRKRTYHGVEIREVQSRKQGFFFVPTFAVHKGWLAVSLFPQAVHGFIARMDGTLERWQPSEQLRSLLAELPQEVIAMSYDDPRPVVRLLLSLAPTIGGLVRSLNPAIPFEVDSIPNAQEATRRLFPNISIATADARAVRVHSLASFSLPFESGALSLYGIIGIFAAESASSK